MPINILIADEHTLIRRGMHSMITAMHAVNQTTNVPDFSIVGDTNSTTGLLDLLSKNSVDILFLGFSLHTRTSENPVASLDGSGLVKWLAREYPSTRIVVLSPYKNANIVRTVLAAGARGYISRDTCERTLLRAMMAVLNGEIYVEKGMMDSLFLSNHGKESELTSREVDILRMLCRGLSLTKISEKIGLSNKTVSAHKLRAMDKLGVQSDCQLYCLLANTGMYDIAV